MKLNMKHPSKSWLTSLLAGAQILCAATAAAGTAPQFNISTIQKADGFYGVPYNASLANDVSEYDGDRVYFLKESGPDWLKVAPNGTLSGTPNHDASNDPWSIVVFDADGHSRATLEIHTYTQEQLPISDITVIADADNYASVDLVWEGAIPGSTCSWYEGKTLLGVGSNLTVEFPVGEHELLFEYDTGSNVFAFDFTVTVLYGIGGPLAVDAGPDFEIIADADGFVTIPLSAWGTGPIESYLWKTNDVVVANGAEASVTLPVGEHTLVVRVKDADKNVVRDELLVNVIKRPDLNPISVVIPDSVPLYYTDGGKGYATVTLRAEASYNSSVNMTPNCNWEINGAQAGQGHTLTVDLEVGEHDVAVIASDADGNTARHDVVVKVEGVVIIDPPPPPPAYVGVPYQYQIPGLEGDEVVSIISGPTWLSCSAGGLLTGTPTATDIGDTIWTLEIHSKDGSDMFTIGILVAIGNPVIDPHVVIGPTRADGYAEVTISVDDIEGFSFDWKMNTVRIGTGPSITVDLPAGRTDITLRIKDPAGNVARDVVIVDVPPYVEPNTNPYFTAEPILKTRARIKKTFKKDISGKAQDDDGDTLSYAIINGPAWLKISSSGVLSGKPSKRDKGTNIVTIAVYDGKGGSDVGTVKIRVK